MVRYTVTTVYVNACVCMCVCILSVCCSLVVGVVWCGLPSALVHSSEALCEG